MRVFVTGASGWVGSEVARQLIGRGHEVVGLARSDKSADVVDATGATVLRGDLADLDVLASAGKAADAVVHCGFIHDFSNFSHSVEVDKRAIEAMGTALAGTNRPLIVTAGTAGMAFGRPSTEEDAPNPDIYEGPARVSEQVGLAQAEKGVRGAVVRLPPSVHGRGDHGFVATLIGIARQKGVSAYIGAGENVWPAVYRDDAAAVYVLALESGVQHPRYHAVGDRGVPFRQIAETIGRRLGVPAVSISPEEAGGHFGWMGNFAGFDVPASADLTAQWLGWQPKGPGLIEDLETGTYFD
jgi:nucleoside-diphosphate-sugar epimerase